MQLVLILCQVEDYRSILKLSCRPLAFTSNKAFVEKKGLEVVSQPDFVNYFLWKIFLLLCSITWPAFIVWLFLLPEILGNRCIIIIVCWPVYDVINFEINLLRLIAKMFFQHDQKVRLNFKYLEIEKSF